MTTSITGVSNVLADARYVMELFAKRKAAQETQAQLPLQAVQLANKMHNDDLAKDPTWINGVHCHDSVSRHNYTYHNVNQKPLANQ